MWAVERDPALTSSFMTVTILDRPADFERFRRRIEIAVATIPRLRQRVVESAIPWQPPGWEDDPDFDLDRHVDQTKVEGGDDPAELRDLLDLAAAFYEEGFDKRRPLWRFTLVNGLSEGRGALMAHLHHTISDGVGAIRLSAMFTDIERDAPDPELPEAVPVVEPESGPSVADAVTGIGKWALDQISSVGQRMRDEPGGFASETVETARSISRQLIITERGRSPLWVGQRSARRRFDAFTLAFDEAKRAATALGGTLNDLYVTGVAAGAGAYHRAMGAPVDELRLTMPVNTRTDKSAGGNSFAPTRFLVPADDIDPVTRFRAIHEQLTATKSERGLGVTDLLAQALRSLPPQVLLPIIRQQIDTVDMAISNTRAAPFDLFIGGALVLANHPMGPTGGTGANITMMSYKNNLDFGLVSDPAAVTDPELLRTCVEEGLADVINAGG